MKVEWPPLRPYRHYDALGEGKARVILTIGKYQELKGYATYQDIARATSLSISRAKTLVKELERKGLVDKHVKKRIVIVRLKDKGMDYYREMIQYLDKDRKYDIHTSVSYTHLTLPTN